MFDHQVPQAGTGPTAGRSWPKVRLLSLPKMLQDPALLAAAAKQ